MQASWSKYTLQFKRPAGTSRGVMQIRPIWFLFLSKNGITGIGECAPLSGLSLDDFNEVENILDKVCLAPQAFLEDSTQLTQFPAVRFALEMANHDRLNGGKGLFFHSPLTTKQAININGLIWMGDKDYMLSQIKEKLEEGWSCIKLKIGGLDFESELEILKVIRQQFSANTLELRLDANGAFNQENVSDRLHQLAHFSPHSIEQPIMAGQYDLLTRLCHTSPIPIALDEELIPLTTQAARKQMLNQVRPQYIVLKPSFLGGFAESQKWIELAKERGIDYWITSALESNMGLQAISQWTAKQNLSTFQGLGTGQLFNNNLPSPLAVKKGKLTQSTLPIWQDIHQFIGEWLHPKKTVSLQTSGSTGKPKSITMDKASMAASAKLTAKTFNLKPTDKALLCLPVNYIAGKMMLVRAMVSQLDLIVVQPSSKPLINLNTLVKFAAMTPMQLAQELQGSQDNYKQLNQIDSLIIGGATIDNKLLKLLQALPISTRFFETYGMTETVSHVAIKALNGKHQTDFFNALTDISFKKDQRGCLVIHAEHISKEPIITNDLIDLSSNKTFKWLGRIDYVINSGGIKIIPEQLEEKLAEVLSQYCFYITGLPDNKLGEKVVLLIEGNAVAPIEKQKNKIFESILELHTLHYYEKPKDIIFIKEFQRTTAGKISRQQTIARTKLI